jgi:hypothetical protein
MSKKPSCHAFLLGLTLLSTFALTACGGDRDDLESDGAATAQPGVVTSAASAPTAQSGAVSGSENSGTQNSGGGVPVAANSPASSASAPAGKAPVTKTPVTQTPVTAAPAPVVAQPVVQETPVITAPPVQTVKTTPLSTTVWPPQISTLASASTCSSALRGSNRTLNVGPGQTYTELTQVPWLSLVAGDVVNVYYRATPYRTKFGLRARGTAAQPVVINGVTDAACSRPEISGDGAVTAADAVATQFWASIQDLGLIQIHRGPSDSDDTYRPEHITLQNLKLTGTHHTKSFTGVDGARHSYDPFASAIYALRVAYLTVENCEITANNMGIFTNSRGNNPIDYSAYTVIRRNKIHLNGSGRSTEHNLYLQSYRTLVEGNYIGAVAGGEGSALKDRSSGTVIRYNHIVSGARALDLVEAEEDSAVYTDPLYNHAWVYGNLIVNDFAQPSYSGRLVHWGCDNNCSRARAGVLNFYNNTLINRSTQSQVYYTSIFHMNADIPASSMVEARSNVFSNEGDTDYYFLAEAGRVNFRGTNFLPTGWMKSKDGVGGVLDQTGAAAVTQANSGLSTEGVPSSSASWLFNKATAEPAGTALPGLSLENLRVTHQYASPQAWVPRVAAGGALDLGAFEAR